MAYSVENEVLYHLTHDPGRDYWDEFTQAFRTTNPFDVAQGVLFDLIKTHRDEDKIPAFEVLDALVRESDDGSMFAARIALDDIRGYKGDGGLFPTAIKALKEKYITRTTLASTKVAQEIVVSGYKIGKQELRGIDAAWQYLQEQRQKIEDVRDSSVSSGNFHENMEELHKKYESTKAALGPNGEVPGRMATGFKHIDEETSGLGGGEFWLVGAYSAEGKSTFLRNLAYTLSVKQGKNVVYATAEMTKGQIENQLLSRHSCSTFWHPDYQHKPLPYRAIRDGKIPAYFQDPNMSPAENKRIADDAEEYRRSAMSDLSKGHQSGQYGMLDVLQVPGHMTIPSLGDYLNNLNRRHRVDVVLIDYALLFADHTRHHSGHENLAAKMRACKMLALDFGTRDQLAVVTAHQFNRVSREEAEARMKPRRVKGVQHIPGMETMPYSMRSLSGTTESEKSADVVIWMLLLEEYKQRNVVRVGLLKNREGSLGKPFDLTTNWACSYISNVQIRNNEWSI